MGEYVRLEEVYGLLELMDKRNCYYTDSATYDRYDKEVQEKLSQLKLNAKPICYRGYKGTLRYILDLLDDYDNCKSVDTLKALIDEVVLIGKKAMENKEVM